MNGRAQNICYVCRKTDTRSGEPFSRLCGCNGKTNLIHFSCVADLIVNYSDPKCPFCKRNFTDPRIRRFPTFNIFLTRGPGIVFTILFFVVNMHFLSERIYAQNLQIKQYVQRFGIFRARMVVSIIGSLFNSILFLLALQCYRIWFRKQPKTIVLDRIINGEPFVQHLDLSVYNETPNGTQRSRQRQFNAEGSTPGDDIHFIHGKPFVGQFSRDEKQKPPKSGSQYSQLQMTQQINRQRFRCKQQVVKRNSL